MSKAIALGIAGVTVSVAMLAFGYAAGSRSDHVTAAVQPPIEQAAPSSQDMARGDVEAIVRDYLVQNPEILIEMQTSLEQRSQEQQRIAQEQTIGNASDEIFNASYDGVIGNPDGDVTIVEFFDYNCGYCKRAMQDMEAMVAADPNLRFVMKEFPILGPDSQKAHVVSMALHLIAPEKYDAFHRELLMSGRATEASAIRAALAQGVDETALREEMKNPAITEAFGKTYELANQLSITGTPSYVVGNEVVFGALGQQVLAEKVELARSCTGENC
jgi:protein-disulfide isomerase